MDKPDYLQEIETRKICDFEIQKDHTIPDNRPEKYLINEKNIIFQLMDFTIPSNQ